MKINVYVIPRSSFKRNKGAIVANIRRDMENDIYVFERSTYINAEISKILFGHLDEDKVVKMTISEVPNKDRYQEIKIRFNKEDNILYFSVSKKDFRAFCYTAEMPKRKMGKRAWRDITQRMRRLNTTELTAYLNIPS